MLSGSTNSFLSAYAVYSNIITTLCIITFQCTGCLAACQNRSVRSFNSMQGVTNPVCYQKTAHSPVARNNRNLANACGYYRSYPNPSVPASWQITHAIIIHLLRGRNPQTSRELRLCTSTSHRFDWIRRLRFLAVVPKRSRRKCRCSAPGLLFSARGIVSSPSAYGAYGVSPERLAYRRLTTDFHCVSSCLMLESGPETGERSFCGL